MISQALTKELEDSPDNQSTAKKEKQATRILNFAASVELFHTPDGEAFACIEANGHYENHFIHSKPFRGWLAYQFFKSDGQMPSSQALQDAINTIGGKALYEGDECELFIRVAGFGENIYVDICNGAWQIIEISKSDWRIIESENAPVKFYRTKAMLPLPMPVPKEQGSIEKLRGFLNVGKDEYILNLAWLINCFRPDYPYPILVVTGEQGAAKSTTSKLLRSFIDPNKTAFRSPPRHEHDLIIAATNAWVCAYDNLSSVPAWLSDGLCRISTGGGFGARTLYENSDETIFSAKRPILLNGIGDIATKGDLLDRAILSRLKHIPKEKRKTERQFWTDFEKVKPIIFSGLLNVVVVSLNKIDAVKLKSLPRMADFAEWAVAAESGFGFKENSFLTAYENNRTKANDTVLEDSPLALAIIKLHSQRTEFDGTVQAFLNALKDSADDEMQKSKDFPKTPRGLRSKLERINPNLRAIGINIIFGEKTENGRLVKMEQIRKQQSEQSEQSDSPENKADTADGLNQDSQPERQTVSQPSANRQNGKHSSGNGLDNASDGSDCSDGQIHTYSNMPQDSETFEVNEEL